MTDQGINVAIAEECGKHVCSHSPARWDRRGPEGDSELFCNDCGEYLHDMRIPDYCHDLNAMHEVEMTLSDQQFWPDYYDNLSDATGGSHVMSLMLRATARQRAEAFLRTVCPEKWKD